MLLQIFTHTLKS